MNADGEANEQELSERLRNSDRCYYCSRKFKKDEVRYGVNGSGWNGWECRKCHGGGG